MLILGRDNWNVWRSGSPKPSHGWCPPMSQDGRFRWRLPLAFRRRPRHPCHQLRPAGRSGQSISPARAPRPTPRRRSDASLSLSSPTTTAGPSSSSPRNLCRTRSSPMQSYLDHCRRCCPQTWRWFLFVVFFFKSNKTKNYAIPLFLSLTGGKANRSFMTQKRRKNTHTQIKLK